MKMPTFNQFLLATGLAASVAACGTDNASIALDAPETQTIAALTTGNADEWLNEATSKRRFIGVKPSGYETPAHLPAGHLRPISSSSMNVRAPTTVSVGHSETSAFTN